MFASYSLLAALGCSFISQVLCIPSELRPRDLNSWVATESVIALQGALNNIGPNGTKVPGAGAGFVVASPSKVNPNCKYCIHRMSQTIANSIRLLHMEPRFCPHSKNDHR